MAIAHDSAFESHTGITGSTNQTSFSWTHTSTSTPVGVLVYVFNASSATNQVTSVTYGGVDLIFQTRAVDTLDEPGDCQVWYLGRRANLPTGLTQTVVVNRNNNTDILYAVSITVNTGITARDTDVTGITLFQENQALAGANVSDGGGGTGPNSMRYAGAYSGLANPPTASATSTLLHDIDFGGNAVAVARQTTAGSGNLAVGLVGNSDDVAAVYLAVKDASSKTIYVDNTADTLAAAVFNPSVAVVTPVGFDASSESHTGTTGNTTGTSFTWNHIPNTDNFSGVLVFTFTNANSDDAVGVTYGGLTLLPVTGGRAVDTAGKPGDCEVWFLSNSTRQPIPTGTQPVVVNRINTSEMYAVAITLTAGTELEPTGVVLLQNDGTLAEQSVTDGSVGPYVSMRFAGINSGNTSIVTNPATPGVNNTSNGANSTWLQNIDFGTRVAGVVRQTTASSGAGSVGFSATTSADRAAVHLAIRDAIGVVIFVPNVSDATATNFAPKIPFIANAPIAESTSLIPLQVVRISMPAPLSFASAATFTTITTSTWVYMVRAAANGTTYIPGQTTIIYAVRTAATASTFTGITISARMNVANASVSTAISVVPVPLYIIRGPPAESTAAAAAPSFTISLNSFGLPIEDISTGAWTPTPLYEQLDDGIHAYDADYVKSSVNASNDIFEVKLSPVITNAVTRSNNRVVYSSYAINTKNSTLTVSLLDGSTVIATWVDSVFSDFPSTIQHFLTQEQMDALSSYSNLRLRFEADI